MSSDFQIVVLNANADGDEKLKAGLRIDRRIFETLSS